MRYCAVCGEELKDEAVFCSSCGADNSASLKNSSDGEKISKGISLSAKQISKNKKDKTASSSKKISNIKLAYLVMALVFVGALLLIASGIFDTPAASGVSAQNNPNDPHSGIDLSGMQQIKELEAKVDANKNDFESLLNLAHLLNDSGFKEKAIDRYKQYLKSRLDEPDVLVDMGVCYYELGRNDDAISNMEKAVKLKPDHQIAHLNLGVVNFSAGNKDKAKDYWSKTVSINPASEVGKRAQELINQH